MITLNMEKFTLNHVVLYAKHWYKCTDFWTDIKACLTADGYSGDLMTNTNVVTVIVGQFERLPKSYASDLLTILEGIQERSCWRYGYCTKNNFGNGAEEYDVNKAIVKYCLSYFQSFDRTTIPLRPPNKKVLPYREDITLKQIIDMFNNKK